MTAATGLAAGLGRYGLAILSVAMAWLILAVLPSADKPDNEPKSKVLAA